MGAKTIAEKIGELKDKRTRAVDAMQAISDLCDTEERTFTDDEALKFDEFDATIKGYGEEIDRAERLDAAQKREAEERSVRAKAASDGGAYDGSGGAHGVRLPNGRITVARNLPKGIAFTRFALALMCTKCVLADAERFAAKNLKWADTPEVVRALALARDHGGAQVLRAAVLPGMTTDPTFAQPLVEYASMTGEFVELLRPASIIGQLQAAGLAFRNVPFNVRIPRQTVGASAQWVGEGKSKPVSRMGFDAITVPFTKIAVIVAITEELARFSTPDAEALVRDDLVKAISEFMNQQFIDPAVTGTPQLAPESVTHGGTLTPSTGGTLAQVTTDIGGMMARIAAANLPLAGLGWVMNPRTAINLANLRTAQDVYAFPEMGQGRLRGFPVIQSNQVPIDGTSETILTLLDTSQVLMADDGSVTLDTSNEASLQLDSSPTSPPTNMISLWQQNMLGIRAERFVYWDVLRAEGVQVLTDVTY